jgi:hypothetical protein
MQDRFGKKLWIFPDGEMPPPGDYPLKGHESVVILNTAKEDARISMVLYFTDREPEKGIEFTVPSERVRCIRMDNLEDICGVSVPVELQYAISLESDVPVVAQYGRLDTRSQPMAFYTTSGYSAM